MSQLIQVRVNDQLTLDMGTLADSEAELVVEPPGVPLAEQIITWLLSRPSAPERHPQRDDLAYALTAACLRWGTWFALLTAPALPLCRPKPPEVRVRDAEMARINIEFSASLERWFELRRDDPALFRQLVARAARDLPGVPARQRHVRRTREQNQLRRDAALTRGQTSMSTMGAFFWDEGSRVAAAWMAGAKPMQWAAAQEGVQAHPLRAITNAIAFSSWRLNGIERYHFGRTYAGPLLARRFNAQEEATLLRAAHTYLYGIFLRFDDLFDDHARTWPEKARPFHCTLDADMTSWDWRLDKSSAEVRFRL